MFNARNEYIHAKLEVTLHKILSVNDRMVVSDIYDKYAEYQRSIYSQLQDFSLDTISEQDLERLKKKLETQSLFYSYCFDRYNLLPSLLLSLGYDVVILVSDALVDTLKDFFEQEIKRLSSSVKRVLNVRFLTITTPNLLFQLKQEATKGSKVVMFVDGNKGNTQQKESNLLITDFKGHKIYFHQGFSLLNYILGNDSVIGILVRGDNGSLNIEILEDKADRSLNLKSYMLFVTNLLVRHLENLIQPDNVHLWNNLLSVYEWFIIDEGVEGMGHIPFKVGKKEYYAIEYDTFKVYPLSKKEYLTLIKQ